jgi:hypothetical protein
MKRSPLSYPSVIWTNLAALWRVSRQQKIPALFVVGFVLLMLGIIFAFLAFAPVLSPFVYPLF